jgi:hypothetical protein
MPIDVLTAACSLGLAAGRELLAKVPGEVGEHAKQAPEARLKRLIKGWTGESIGHGAAGDKLRELLKKSLSRHRYPMMNRLKGIKVLIDDLVLQAAPSGDDVAGAVSRALELLDMKTQFAAPLHFTPSQSGTTFALMCLRWGKCIGQRCEYRSLFRAAQRDLKTSEEMYTQRRAYYEAISGLFYLYDDFNDRQIHFNHAIQMAGAELTTLLSELLGRWERYTFEADP